MSVRPSVIGLFLAAAAATPDAVASAQMRSFSVAGRVSHDVGTVFVSGTESGPGGGIGARVSFGDDDVRWEPEVSIDVAGFKGAGDGDPIFQGTFLVARRAFFFLDDEGARPWWSLGAGVGGLAIAGGGAAFPARFALGVSLAPRSSLGLEASVYNRFVFISTGRNEARAYINSTGVEIAVRFGQ